MRLFTFAISALALTLYAAPPSALAQEGAAPAKQVTKIGYLNCHVASGWGFIFGSSGKLQCVYTPAEKGKKIENYSGSITKFGADVGYLQFGVILWTVLAPGMKITENPGLLSGHYGGATASATLGLGLGRLTPRSVGHRKTAPALTDWREPVSTTTWPTRTTSRKPICSSIVSIARLGHSKSY